jgi:hypothetical protein
LSCGDFVAPGTKHCAGFCGHGFSKEGTAMRNRNRSGRKLRYRSSGRRARLEKLEDRRLLAHFPLPQYDFDVVATTSGAFSDIGLDPSINDDGDVAFVATNSNGQGIFFSDASSGTPGTPILLSAQGGNITYGRGAWLNNNNVVVASQRRSGTTIGSQVLRLYDADSPGSQQAVASGGVGTPGGIQCIFDPFLGCIPIFRPPSHPDDFDGILSFAAVNNNVNFLGPSAFINVDNNVVFAALQTGGTSVIVDRTPVDEDTGDLVFANQTLVRPAIDDLGGVVLKAGKTSTDPILRYTGGLFGLSAQPIATSVMGFTDLGISPGVSDDGKIVTFYGNLSESGAHALTQQNQDVIPVPVTPGRGIYASIEIAGRRHILKVAGEIRNTRSNGNSIIDPGERLLAGSGLDSGQDYDFDGQPDWSIKSFDPDSRVGVSVDQNGFATVVYIAMEGPAAGPAVDKEALFASRINFFNAQGFTAWQQNDAVSAGVEAPIMVVRADSIPFGSATDLNLFDPVNENGEIVFFATTGSTRGIIRAKPDASNAYFANRFNPDSPLVEYIVRHTSNTQHNQTRAGADPNQIILHATGGDEHDGSLIPLTTNVSVHYLISQEGRVTQIIRENNRANHALNSLASTANQAQTNNNSIGIELVDTDGVGVDGHRNAGWAEEILLQKAALLVRDIARRNNIVMEHAALTPKDFFVNANGYADTTQQTIDYNEGYRYDSNAPGMPFVRSGKTYRGANFQAIPTADVNPGVNEFHTPADFQAGTNSGTGAFPRGTRVFADGYAHTVNGVLGHGQVKDRTIVRDDPDEFDWISFMAQVNQQVVIQLNSPANLLVTDPQGNRVGVDPISGAVVNEIAGATFSGTAVHPQTITLPPILAGQYSIAVNGTAVGPYTLDVYAGGIDGSVTRTQVGGHASVGSADSFQFDYLPGNASGSTLFGTANLRPFAQDDKASTFAETDALFNVLQNDSDPEGALDVTSVNILNGPSNGSVISVSGTGEIVYRPNVGFAGSDSFTYEVLDTSGVASNPAVVSIEVLPALEQIAFDDMATTVVDTAVAIVVLANDDLSFDIVPGTVSVKNGPSNGTTVVDPTTGVVNYSPDLGFIGTDSFDYAVNVHHIGVVEAAVTIVVSGNANTAPTVDITGPTDGSSFAGGTNVSFAGTASDTEDGNLSGSLTWTSSIDGAIGTGGSFMKVLSVGTHTITASATDSGGLNGVATITVTIDPNTAPVVTITGPADGSSFAAGTNVSFAGTASDTEDGNLSGSLTWTSSIDGAIGTGGSFMKVLSVGTHTITAQATDSGGLPGSSSITVTINPPLVAPQVSQFTVNGGSTQRSNIDSLAVKFSQNVNLQALITSGQITTAVRLFNGGLVSLTASRYRYDATTFTLTIDVTTDGFGGSKTTRLTNAVYELRLDTSLITAAANSSNRLADDDGTADGIRRYQFHRLLGDYNGDRTVGTTDRDAFFTHYGSTSGQARYDFAFDLTGDGTINISDYLAFTRLMGQSV